MNYKSRFRIAYAAIWFFLVSMVASALVTVAVTRPSAAATQPLHHHSSLPPITNKSSGAVVEHHFADGKEHAQFPASSIGMRDGTCYAYTNMDSWVAIECFGAVKQG